jgi:hypothetical protein
MGNYYTKPEADNLFCNKNNIDSNYYTKPVSDSRFAPTSFEGSLNNYYTKPESDSRFSSISLVDSLATNYYDKPTADSLFAPISIVDTLNNNYYDKPTSDSIFAPASVSIQYNDIKSNLATNYYDATTTDSKFVSNTSLSGILGNYYTIDQVNGYCTPKSTIDPVVTSLKNYYTFITANAYTKTDINNMFVTSDRYNSFVNNLNASSLFGAKQTVINTDVSFNGATSDQQVGSVFSFSNDGFITCFLSLNQPGQNINGSIFLRTGTTRIAGCSVVYQYGADYETYANSFTYPVKKNTSYSIAKYTASGSNNGTSSSGGPNGHVVVEFQPMFYNVSG